MRPSPKDVEGGFWGGWARALTTRPWWAILGVFALLIPLIVPFLSLNLGQEDIGATPKSTTERQAYDLMAAGFGVGYNGPLLVAVKLGSSPKPSSEYTSQQQQAQSLQKQLEQEQKQGKTQQQQLTGQANSLNAQSKQLTAQQQQLEQQEGSLKAQQAELERAGEGRHTRTGGAPSLRNTLEAEQVALNKQIAGTGSQARTIVRDGAKTTKQLTSVLRRLTKNQAEQRKLEAQIEHAQDASEKKKLEAKLRALQKEETKLENQLDQARPGGPGEPRGVPGPARPGAGPPQAGGQRRQPCNRARRTGRDARERTPSRSCARSRRSSRRQPTCRCRRRSCRRRRPNLQTQAAQLQTQQVKLQGQQQTAQGQQKQAEQLKE